MRYTLMLILWYGIRGWGGKRKVSKRDSVTIYVDDDGHPAPGQVERGGLRSRAIGLDTCVGRGRACEYIKNVAGRGMRGARYGGRNGVAKRKR